MQTKLLIALVVAAAITLAVSGWIVQALRWALGGFVPRRPRAATA